MLRTLLLSFTLPYFLHSALSFSYKEDPFSTHQPVLFELVKRTEGPIIEFGCGNGSTDLLHELCKKNQRMLISIDDNFEWLQKFAKKYENEPWHEFYFVEGKESPNSENDAHWVKFLDQFTPLDVNSFDVCFIDQHPWHARWETVKRMKEISRYVIVHDCDYFPHAGIFGKTIVPIQNHKEGIFDFSDVFATFKVYFPKKPWPGSSGPPTLVGSNFEMSLPEVNFNLD